MKTYTVRFAHLQELPIAKIADVIFPGDKVGKMGTTGQSKFPHLHIDVIEGLQKIKREFEENWKYYWEIKWLTN